MEYPDNVCHICAHPLTLYHHFHLVDGATDPSAFLLSAFTCQIVKFGPKTFHGLVQVTTVVQLNSSEEVHENITKEKPHPNQVPSEPSLEPEQEPKPAYTWTKSGHTECSTTCGTGKESFG